jgi:hypothetical protein
MIFWLRFRCDEITRAKAAGWIADATFTAIRKCESRGKPLAAGTKAHPTESGVQAG